MSYTIKVANQSDIVIETGITDNSTSLSLIGKNVPNYGVIIAQNFVKLMQNFAGTEIPNGPVDGQLYYDTNINALRLCQGGVFTKVLASVTTTAGTTPSSSNVGDLWWDSTAGTLNLYNGAGWTPIGPYTLNSSAAAIPDTVVDSNGVSRDIIRFAVGTTTVMIISKIAFVPQTNQTVSNASLSGFPIINAGVTLNILGVTDNSFTGNVIARQMTSGPITASSISAGSIGNTNATLTGTLQTGYQPNITSVGTLNGLAVQNNANFQSSITVTSVVSGATGSFATIEGNNLNLSSLATVGNVITTSGVYWANGVSFSPPPSTAFNGTVGATTPSTGRFTTLSTTGQFTVNSTSGLIAIANGGTSGIGNIGATGATFNTVFAKATTAQYADLAEKYHSDRVYASGTVMKIGGSNEITRCDEEYSYDVFGVISTEPAYLMNDTTQDELWLPVVLIGRCPVNVIGPVSKGERLVSAGNGYAKASDKGVCFRTAIGRSLVDKTSETAELIECFINTN